MKSVVFCSSQRFSPELKEFITKLKQLADERNQHIVVLDPEFNGIENQFDRNCHEKDRLADPNYRDTVAGKVYDHLFRKVRVADVCFIYNKDGYVGVNATGELFAAAMAGKICYALENKLMMGNYPNNLYEEPSGRKLIHEIIPTPEELLKRLL